MALRWGIAAAGKISHDFSAGLALLAKENHKIVAVAARDQSRAQEFAKLHSIEKAYGSYKELATDSDIDIVYIGVLNPQHYEVSKIMLEHGKHVLCEKPLCMNEKQAKQLVALAAEKKVFFMEAVWSRFFPVYQYLRQQLDAGVLGDITEVNVSFGFELSSVDRLQKKDLGGSTVLDLGIYTIQICQWVFRTEPISIKAKGELNEEGVDIEMEAELTYANEGKAFMKTSAKETQGNTAVIKGTKGEIKIPHFWCPTSLIDVDGTEKSWPLPETKFKLNFSHSEGLSYEAEAARKLIADGKLESEEVSHAESLIFARIEDEIRKQIGVVYPEDLE